MTYSFDVTVHETTISVEMDPSTGSVTLEGERFNARHDPEHARIVCERAIEAVANRFVGKRDEIRQEGYDEGYAAGLEDAEAEITQSTLDRECRNAFDEGQKRMKAMLDIEHAQSIKPHTDEGFKAGRADADANRAACIEDARRKAYAEGVTAGKAEISEEINQTYNRAHKAGQEAARTRLRTALGL